MTRRQDNMRQDNHSVNPLEWQIYEVHNPTSCVLRDFDSTDSLRDFDVWEFQTLQSIFSLKYSIPGVTDREPCVPHDQWL
jgi:hypothetical protein